MHESRPSDPPRSASISHTKHLRDSGPPIDAHLPQSHARCATLAASPRGNQGKSDRGRTATTHLFNVFEGAGSSPQFDACNGVGSAPINAQEHGHRGERAPSSPDRDRAARTLRTSADKPCVSGVRFSRSHFQRHYQKMNQTKKRFCQANLQAFQRHPPIQDGCASLRSLLLYFYCPCPSQPFPHRP